MSHPSPSGTGEKRNKGRKSWEKKKGWNVDFHLMLLVSMILWKPCVQLCLFFEGTRLNMGIVRRWLGWEEMYHSDWSILWLICDNRQYSGILNYVYWYIYIIWYEVSLKNNENSFFFYFILLLYLNICCLILYIKKKK